MIVLPSTAALRGTPAHVAVLDGLAAVERAAGVPATRRLLAALLAAEAIPTRAARAPDARAADPPAARAAGAAVARAVGARALGAATIAELHDRTAGRDGAPLGLRTTAGYLHRTDADGRRVELMFEGAAADTLTVRLDELGAWADDRDGDAVTQALGAFLQLVALHPFLDGNGRTARLLVHAVLRRRGAVRAAVAPLGPLMARDQPALVAMTADWRAGDTVGALTALAVLFEASVRRTVAVIGC